MEPTDAHFNALPPLPSLGWIVNHDRCEHGKIVFRGLTVEPEPACELGLTYWDHWAWAFSADERGRLVVHADNGDHVFEVMGLNQDYQHRLYLRLRHVETRPPRDPPVGPSPAQERRIRTPWKTDPDGDGHVRTVAADFHDGEAPVLDGDPPVIEPPGRN